jgi:hypothetical protein
VAEEEGALADAEFGDGGDCSQVGARDGCEDVFVGGAEGGECGERLAGGRDVLAGCRN